MERAKRTVIIAGGGISGLALANMLEKAGVSYILLEAYEKIAPQVGASIGLQANGLRILDQLGCLEELQSLVAEYPLNDTFVRNSDGSIIKHHTDVASRLTERHGYATIFIDRQMLMQTLYENLESTESIYPGQKVESVRELDHGVQVTTDKGKVFKGDILVGADGVYSTIRKEMWRIGNEKSPGYFPPDEWSKVPCYYKCIFGISHPIKELTNGVHYIYNDNFSYLVMVGPGGRFYWFLFAKLPEPLYGKDIPSYTKQDEEKLAQEHAYDMITPEVSFGQLYEARTNSTLTPLHEWVFEKWHYNRIVTIGDAAHKFEPLTGHGGNAAIESAASLVNHLLSDECRNWSDSEIQTAFSATQQERQDRVQWLVDDAHTTQQMQAKATPLLATIGPILARLFSTPTAIRLSGRKFVAATRVNNLPMPHQPHTVPYDDELPEKPLSSSLLPLGLGIVSQGGLSRAANKLLFSLSFPAAFGGDVLVSEYTGIQGVDRLLKVLVAVFGVPLTSGNAAARMQWIAFMPLLCSTTLDWTLESYRAGSKHLFTSFPSVFGMIYQLKGIGRIAPLYHLISVCEQALGGTLSTVTGSSVTKEAVESTIAGLAIGCIVPSALMTWPFKNNVTWQKFTALWQPFPAYVGLITLGASKGLSKREVNNAKALKDGGKAAERRRETHSLLRHAYAIGTATATLYHLWTLYRISSSPNLSISSVFGSMSSLFSDRSSLDPDARISAFLQRDMLLNAASVLAHSIYRTLSLRSLGYITNEEAVKTSLAVLIAQPIVGPAAAHIGFLGWREEVYARINKRIGA